MIIVLLLLSCIDVTVAWAKIVPMHRRFFLKAASVTTRVVQDTLLVEPAICPNVACRQFLQHPEPLEVTVCLVDLDHLEMAVKSTPLAIPAPM